MDFIKTLFVAPEVNPVTGKARSLPFFNPVNVHGRVFFFSWFGFFIAFWSWYAFPPLLSEVIALDVGLSKAEVANSNVIGTTATLLVRLVSGPLCDRYGPRLVFAITLFAGSIPTFCAGGITNATGLYFLRFFLGVLGGTFVPCQVWLTGFYDKNIVGTANGLAGGFGNAGGGITYFLMPAIYDAFLGDGLTRHQAWRVAFVVPGVIIIAVATGILLLCPDTPTGRWSERFSSVDRSLASHHVAPLVVTAGTVRTVNEAESATVAAELERVKAEKNLRADNYAVKEAHISGEEMLEIAVGEVVRAPTPKEILTVIFSVQTLVLGALYFCSFGAELAINSILGTWYHTNFASQGFNLKHSGRWAAMFGLLNFFCRPFGGMCGDLVYLLTGNVWSKKVLLHTYGLITGGFLIAIGVLDSRSQSTMFGLVAAMAFFDQGANGISYSLVPHVHPYANGIVSGFVGACGPLGGIVFALVFRYNLDGYGKSVWIIGCVTIAVNLVLSWIKPLPKGQIGGR